MNRQCPAQLILARKYAQEPQTRVAHLMLQYRVTIRDIHEVTGISTTVLHGLRHGHHRMSEANAEKLAAFFGVTTDDVRRRLTDRREEAA